MDETDMSGDGRLTKKIWIMSPPQHASLLSMITITWFVASPAWTDMSPPHALLSSYLFWKFLLHNSWKSMFFIVSVCYYEYNPGILRSPCCHYHVTYQCQFLCHFSVIHKSYPVASWDSKVSIVCTQNLTGSSTFFYSFMSTVNLDILKLFFTYI